MFKKIILHEPLIKKKEIEYVNEALKKGFIANGPYLKKFSETLKKKIKVNFAIPVVNGTSALHTALIALNIKANDEILVPSLTFVATINAIMYTNAKPVFMDSDESLNIDLKKTIKFLEKETFYKKKYTYNKKTKSIIKAIIIVHTFGNLVDLQKIYSLCNIKNIRIIEDAAESLGSYYIGGKFDKKYSGTIGDIGIISFNYNKSVTSGGGGMIVTNSKNLAIKSIKLINQSKKDNIRFIHDDVGYNYRLSNIHAALGFGQIQRLKEILSKKKLVHEYYGKLINKINGVELIEPLTYCRSNYWLNVVRIKKLNYTKLIELINFFDKNNIETRPLWYPNHKQIPFKKFQSFNITYTNKIINHCICLPSSPSLQFKDIDKIINLLVIFLRKL